MNTKIKKIKKVRVKRMVDQTISYVKKVEKEVEIDPLDISIDEIYTLDIDQAIAIAVLFKKRYDEASRAIEEYLKEAQLIQNQNQEPVPTPTDVEEVEESGTGRVGSEKKIDKEAEVGSRVDDGMEEKVGSGKVDSSAKKQSMRGTHSTGVPIGTKRGESSQYHYVYWDKSKNKWANVFTNNTFNDEIECAIEVNRYLDRVKDFERPRNKIDIDEVESSASS